MQVVARAMVLFALRQRRNWNLLSGQRNTVSGGGCPTETLVVAHSHLTILLSWENHIEFEAVQTGCVWPHLACGHHLAPYPPAVPGSLFSEDPLPLLSVPV